MDPSDLAPTPQSDAPPLEAGRGERRVLVLQGGGALGSYQAGVYQALCHHGFEPDWVAGISIGAINAALIAGNPPERRRERLKEFWELVTSPVTWRPFLPGDQARTVFNETSAALIATFGVPGFFRPRFPAASLWPGSDPQSLSYYDTAPLRETLLKLVDFDRINGGDVRLSVGAVNVRTGNFAYFDSTKQKIGPEHIMASGALPPGFPAVEIDGESYWDGGLVSNTPLDYVLGEEHRRDMVIFQVDLFSARGPLPTSLMEAAEREKDIRYSSRTRMVTDIHRTLHNTRKAVRDLISLMPPEWRADPAVAQLGMAVRESTITVMHLIYRDKKHEGNSKDFDFSRLGMVEHWTMGEHDVHQSMNDPRWLARHQNEETLVTFDLTENK
ncbi:MAG: patatin-like phospholipase family protein [Xanthobacteraceae bacterium]|nr:MAG: patatin-like phospholipase family protein [Xanthobacteraceae bacterium]